MASALAPCSAASDMHHDQPGGTGELQHFPKGLSLLGNSIFRNLNYNERKKSTLGINSYLHLLQKCLDHLPGVHLRSYMQAGSF